MWPRKLDGSFNIGAITDHVLALVHRELSDPKIALQVPASVSAAASGLHVVHLAGVRLGVVVQQSEPEALVNRVEDARVRQRIEAHGFKRGLTDGDMRALADAGSLFLGREMRLDDHDPLEPINERILRILKVCKRIGREVERRYVLLLDRHLQRIDVADPGGIGVASIAVAELRAAWKLGATGRPWVATISGR
jgi:hypothetical protein